MRNPTFFWLVSLSFSASKKGLRQMVSQVLNHAAWTPKKGKEDIHYLTICYLHYNYKMIIYAADYLRFTHCGKTFFHQFGFTRHKNRMLLWIFNSFHDFPIFAPKMKKIFFHQNEKCQFWNFCTKIQRLLRHSRVQKIDFSLLEFDTFYYVEEIVRTWVGFLNRRFWYP